jgi:hypothetical protein
MDGGYEHEAEVSDCLAPAIPDDREIGLRKISDRPVPVIGDNDVDPDPVRRRAEDRCLLPGQLTGEHARTKE